VGRERFIAVCPETNHRRPTWSSREVVGCALLFDGRRASTCFEVCSVAVKASILRSNSATRLSVFFCRFRVGCVTMHDLPALAHRLHGSSGLLRSGSQRTLSCRQASQARGRFKSEYGSFGSAESRCGEVWRGFCDSYGFGTTVEEGCGRAD
jgi:hypothetical protein